MVFGLIGDSKPGDRRLFFDVVARLTQVVTIVCFFYGAVSAADSQVLVSERTKVRVTELASGLEHPWGLAFLPNGAMLITERPGRLRYFYEGELSPQFIKGLPPVYAEGQGGLLDVVIDPKFSVNRFIYFSYVRGASGRMATSVARARLEGMTLSGLDVIFNSNPMTGQPRHFGSRLLFGLDGALLVTLGDHGQRSWAQDRTVDPGSVIRIWPTGGIPYDNPFVGGPRPGRRYSPMGIETPKDWR